MHGILASLVVGLVVGSCAGGPRPASPGTARVRSGLEVLIEDSLQLVRGRRVGLVTNQAGVDRNGVANVERLRAAGVELRALFSPEHGFRGSAAPGAVVASSRDSATSLPIYSLYGRTSAPTDSMLAGLDLLVVDLQDVGARYYTYLSTTVEVMRAGARRGIPVLVLDRPDPIGGLVQGNVLEPASRTFVGVIDVPMRHGMTIGELARLADADLGIGADLTVVPLAGWSRSIAMDETGLPFVPPSPNLRTAASLFHYPGLCLFEGTNLSVGRGSDRPFEQIGAPWLDTAAVLAAVRRADLPGVAFESTRFRPERPGDGKYADTTVAGIRLRVTGRSAYDPTAAAVHLLDAIRRLHPDRFEWIPAHFDRLAGTPRLRAALDAGEDPARIVAGWGPDLVRFRQRRAAALLYPDR